MKLTADIKNVFCELPVFYFETHLHEHLPCGLASILSPPFVQHLNFLSSILPGVVSLNFISFLSVYSQMGS